jgi:glutamyl-tRNA synthetase
MSDRSDMKFSLTRIAPTPSGYLHLGNVFSFLVTAGLAKRYGARILLRIDDMDRARVRPEYVDDIFETLHFLGIHWDEGPRGAVALETTFSQRHRMGLYIDALDHLRASGMLFACTCSRSMLAQEDSGYGYRGTCLHKNISLDEPGVSWRLRTDAAADISLRDPSGMEQTYPFPSSMRQVIVRKKDGDPAYQLSSVVDDIHFGVDLVIRGEDLLDSTLVQCYLSRLLPANRFAESAFFHHRLLTGAHGEKLSKSAGDTSVRFFRERGGQPADIFSAIANISGIAGFFTCWEDIAERLIEQCDV